ncbi:hypothetical protein KIL84_016662 [Mauremys mutica]|uniref:Uncharacterized protein n=1 Tax=Mauremys mutica TaxID=74926 RepID=A0A9D3X4N8_9SAUR|nr:hypothetical protein KIL84_016662 [Mauremys mutica]
MKCHVFVYLFHKHLHTSQSTKPLSFSHEREAEVKVRSKTLVKCLPPLSCWIVPEASVGVPLFILASDYLVPYKHEVPNSQNYISFHLKYYFYNDKRENLKLMLSFLKESLSSAVMALTIAMEDFLLSAVCTSVFFMPCSKLINNRQ